MQRKPILHLPPEHRVRRVQTWLARWLAWLAAHALAVVAPELAARCLADLSHIVRDVLMVRALHRVRPPARPHRPRCYDPRWRVRRLSFRSMAGMRLKRALRGDTPAAQCEALCAMLRNPERWVVHIARRLARRFTKLRRPRYPAPPCAALSASATAIACADTS
jgi:hypothetical protein